MSEFYVYSIGKTSGDVPLGPAARQENHRAAVEKSESVKTPIPMHTFPGSTRLIFKVDNQNHDVVVMIVDEMSSEVIRTVPGDAMDDIPSGGLIQRNA